MDFLIAAYLSYKLHLLAQQKEQSSALWIIRFVAGWLSLVLLIVFFLFRQYGEALMEDRVMLLALAIGSILLQGATFLLLKNRLQQFPDPVEPENETIDVSYFR